MPDDLRTRIAAALAVIECEDRCGAPHGHPGCKDCVARMLPQADAVIAELGLRRVIRSERVPIHRYVTDWKADDE